MSSDDEEEQGEEGDEAEQEEEEERSSGNEASDGGETAATTVKARRVAGTEPAAKKLKLRRSNRKRGSKPVGLQIGDAVEGKYGPLCVVAGGVRRSRSTLRGYIVAEAGGGKKNCWHVRWEGVDPSRANSREQQSTTGGIPSTKLKITLAGADTDDDGDSSACEADAMEGEWDEDFESSEDGTEQESEDEDLSKPDIHVHQRQNSDFF